MFQYFSTLQYIRPALAGMEFFKTSYWLSDIRLMYWMLIQANLPNLATYLAEENDRIRQVVGIGRMEKYTETFIRIGFLAGLDRKWEQTVSDNRGYSVLVFDKA